MQICNKNYYFCSSFLVFSKGRINSHKIELNIELNIELEIKLKGTLKDELKNKFNV